MPGNEGTHKPDALQDFGRLSPAALIMPIPKAVGARRKCLALWPARDTKSRCKLAGRSKYREAAQHLAVRIRRAVLLQP